MWKYFPILSKISWLIREYIRYFLKIAGRWLFVKIHRLKKNLFVKRLNLFVSKTFHVKSWFDFIDHLWTTKSKFIFRWNWSFQHECLFIVSVKLSRKKGRLSLSWITFFSKQTLCWREHFYIIITMLFLSLSLSLLTIKWDIMSLSDISAGTGNC